MSRAITQTYSDTTAVLGLLPINRWLIWKEARQLLPLFVSLAAVGLLMLLFLGYVVDGFTLEGDGVIAILVFPGLYAVGAGPILVGQESDLRTLDWLTSLPIAPRQLFSVKVAVALVGLMLMWLLALIPLIYSRMSPDWTWRGGGFGMLGDGLVPVSYAVWMAHTGFVLMSGFLASWTIKNQFIAIVSVGPLACIPIVACELLSEITISAHRSKYDVPLAWLGISIVLLMLLVWVTYRAALKTLAPQAAPSLRRVIGAAEIEEGRTPVVTVPAPTFHSQFTPIVWQFLHSSRMPVIVLSAMILVGVVAMTVVADQGSREREIKLFFTSLIPFLAVSWLGVSVFKHDGNAMQLRFLADRGVRPSKIYLGRHAVPVAVIVSGLIAYTILATLQSNQLSRFFPSMPTMGLICLVIYSVSQWASQLLRMPTLALIAAPIFSLIALRWCWIAAYSLQAPLWMLFALSFPPLLTTWWMMQRYMDMRDQTRSWLLGFAMVAVVVAMPVVPAVAKVYSFVRSHPMEFFSSELHQEAMAIFSDKPRSIDLNVVFYANGQLAMSDSTQQQGAMGVGLLKEDAARPEDFIPGLAELRKGENVAARMSADDFRVLLPRLMQERIELDNAQGDPDKLSRFSQWIDSVSLIIQSLRRSIGIFDHEVADRLEIWLVDSLQSEALETHRNDDFFVAAVRRLPDRGERTRSRRSAVLGNWVTGTHPDLPTTEGIVIADPFIQRLDTVSHELPFRLIMVRFGSFITVALDVLDNQSMGNDDVPWERRMHEALVDPSVPFQNGPYSPRMRKLPAIMTIDGAINYPARYWGMDWEQTVAELKRDVGTSESESDVEAKK